MAETTAAPAAATETQTTTQTTPATQPKPASESTTVTPAVKTDPLFLSDRLERERRSVLKQLGVKAPKNVPAASAIAQAKENIQGQKERRRAAERENEELKTKVADLESRGGVLKTFAELEMQSLDDKTREIVKSLAGDDHAEQLRQIAAIRVIGKGQAPTQAAPATTAPVTTPTPPATSPAPASTAAPPAPAPATTQVAPPVAERYAQIKAISDPTQREAAKLFFVLENEADLLTSAAKR